MAGRHLRSVHDARRWTRRDAGMEQPGGAAALLGARRRRSCGATGTTATDARPHLPPGHRRPGHRRTARRLDGAGHRVRASRCWPTARRCTTSRWRPATPSRARSRVDRWFGTGVLKLARPGEPWSVWLFWEPGWQFKNWYVNLEEPLAPLGRRGRLRGPLPGHRACTRTAAGSWRDEDEFAQAQRGRADGRRRWRSGYGRRAARRSR